MSCFTDLYGSAQGPFRLNIVNIEGPLTLHHQSQNQSVKPCQEIFQIFSQLCQNVKAVGERGLADLPVKSFLSNLSKTCLPSPTNSQHEITMKIHFLNSCTIIVHDSLLLAISNKIVKQTIVEMPIFHNPINSQRSHCKLVSKIYHMAEKQKGCEQVHGDFINIKNSFIKRKLQTFTN